MTIHGKIEVVRGDITKIAVDAIVNAANTSLLGGGGVDGAIHRAGGTAIIDECKEIIRQQGGCSTGEAVITTAGRLPAKFVIHTVGPVWNGGRNGESEKLRNCYWNSLQLAEDNDCRDVAFPGISTGVYRFPKNEASKIAFRTVYEFLWRPRKIEKVIFVCFDPEYFNLISAEAEGVL
jgi:O-acetyl-ADP-ribose deacetylase (regulator of RNase III)